MLVKKKITWSMGHALPLLHGHNWVAIFEYNGECNQFGILENWIRIEWEDKILININHLALSPYIHSDDRFDSEVEEIGFIPVPFEPNIFNIAVKLHAQACQMLDLDPFNLVVKLRETDTSLVEYCPKGVETIGIIKDKDWWIDE